MAIGAIIISGIIGLFVTNTNASKDVLRATHLNQEMRTLLEVMSSNVRKAGYWANTTRASAAEHNPFGIEKVSNNPDCILFSYDTDDSSDVILTSEKHGYRLNNRAIESRVNGTDCVLSNTWEALSNNQELEITTLSFTQKINCSNISDPVVSNCTAGSVDYVTPDLNDVLIEIRVIDIEISGNLKTEPNKVLTLKDTVIVANDSTKIVSM